MKITKSQLKQIIKEELKDSMEDPMEDPMEDLVYILAEPSQTYEGKYVEIKLLGVFLDEADARAALRQLATQPGSYAEVFAIPVGKVNTFGYSG